MSGLGEAVVILGMALFCAIKKDPLWNGSAKYIYEKYNKYRGGNQ